MTFTRQEYITIGEKHRLSDKQCEYYIEKLLARNILERPGRGRYSFVKGKPKDTSILNPKKKDNGEETPFGDTL